MPLHLRVVGPLLLLTALALGPWTLYLTYSLPSRHLARHYDLAWVGFDLGLVVMFSATAAAAYRRSRLLVPFAAATAALLVCDAWFDVVTSSGGSEQVESILEACFAELPLAALCAYVVWDVERFLQLMPRRRR